MLDFQMWFGAQRNVVPSSCYRLFSKIGKVSGIFPSQSLADILVTKLDFFFLQLPLLKHFPILARVIQIQSLVIPSPGAPFCLHFVDGVFTEMSPKRLLLHFSKFFMLLSQLVQGKIFKLKCHTQKNAESFADFCEFRPLGSYNRCIAY